MYMYVLTVTLYGKPVKINNDNKKLIYSRKTFRKVTILFLLKYITWMRLMILYLLKVI